MRQVLAALRRGLCRAALFALAVTLALPASCSRDVPPHPTLHAEPLSGYPPLTVTLDGSRSSSIHGPIVGYAWQLGDGTSSDAPLLLHTYERKGQYLVTLVITDATGRTGHASTTIDAKNRPPVAAFDVAPSVVARDQWIRFDAARSTDPDGIIVAWEWRFPDGSFYVGPSISHWFQAAGVYDVELTVIDEDGAASTVTRALRVIGCDSCH